MAAPTFHINVVYIFTAIWGYDLNFNKYLILIQKIRQKFNKYAYIYYST